jgi:tetratricopeptide (TPR) repeat protein
MGNTTEQKHLLENIISINPLNAPALASLGTVAYDTKAYNTAESYFDKAISIDPFNGEGLVGKGKVRRYYHDLKTAEQLFTKAITQYPDWVTPLLERARLYREAGFYKEALNDLNVAKSLAPDEYWVAIDRGNVFIDLGKKKEALQEFEQAIAINPNYFLAYVYCAGIKNELEDYIGAEQAYKKLSELNPDYYFAFEGLGVLYMRDGRWDQAARAFLEAYSHAPTETYYALLATVAWFRCGAKKNAKALIEKVLPGIPQGSIEWYMFRLFYDESGDTDMVVRIDNEKSLTTRSRMLYYLAQYYESKGNDKLACQYYLLVRDLQRKDILEWHLNEWALQAHSL